MRRVATVWLAGIEEQAFLTATAAASPGSQDGFGGDSAKGSINVEILLAGADARDVARITGWEG